MQSKIIFHGLEGSGKTLRMSAYIMRILNDNARYLKKTGIARPIYANIRFSEYFLSLARSKNIPIHYWNNLEDIVGLSGCDIVIDEIGTYFDSRLWTELSLDVRRWIAQCDKQGVNILGTAQDFAQVDKAFRRLVKKLFVVFKIAGSPRPHPSYPRVRFPWGIFMYRALSPRGYKEDEPELSGTGLPWFFFLQKKFYSIYDTNARVEKSSPPPLRHIVRHCPDCGLSKLTHV